jgi:hypothetical protein
VAGRLTHKTWLTLRETASRIGRELLVGTWSDRILDHDPDLIDDGTGPVKLSPKEVRHFAFQIDLVRGHVTLNGSARPFQCEVNTHDLERFLAKYRSSRASYQSTADKEAACSEWLRAQMSDQSKQKNNKSSYRSEAISRFGVSRRAFDNSWDLNAPPSWRKAGRPRKSSR